MVEAIAKRLELPEVTEKVYIHQVATEFEINRRLPQEGNRESM